MTRRILLSVALTNLALVAWAVGGARSSADFLLLQGTTLVAGGAIAGFLLYVQHGTRRPTTRPR